MGNVIGEWNGIASHWDAPALNSETETLNRNNIPSQEHKNKALRANQPVPCGMLGMKIQSADKSNVKVKSEKLNVKGGKRKVKSERWKTIFASMR